MGREISEKFLVSVLSQIADCGMLDAGDRWLLAVSGGPDSMAMMHSLIALAEAGLIDLAYMHVAHLNHRLRGLESDADAEFVSKQAAGLKLECTVGTIDIGRAAKQSGESIETAARQGRYRFLAETAERFNCNKIATAHNADDNIETILHRVIRGTGIKGLAGIPAVRRFTEAGGETDLHLVRPMLSVRRQEIEQFLSSRNIESQLDSSNLSQQYMRNRIRGELLPLLKEKYNPNVHASLLRLGAVAQGLSEILIEDVAADLADVLISRQDDRVVLDATAMTNKPRIRQAQIVRHILDILQVPQQNIGYRQISLVLDMVGDPNRQKTIELPYRLKVSRKEEQLIFEKIREYHPITDVISLLVPGETTIDAGFVYYDQAEGCREFGTVMTQCLEGGMDDLAEFLPNKTARQEMLDFDKVTGDLQLRAYKPGDRFWQLGSTGEKKLGDFFTDAKLPVGRRKQIGLLCDKQGIIWVMGMRITDRVKVSVNTQNILKLQIC